MKDVALTALTSIGAILSLIYVTRLIAQFGPEAFGAYGLSRRVLAVLTSLTTIPLGVATTRYVALSNNAEQRRRYFLSALLAAVANGITAVVAAMLFRSQAAQLVFHAEAYAWLVVATVALFAGMCVYSPTYAYFRGSGRMDIANGLNLVLLSVGPLLATVALFHTRSLETIVFATAAVAALAVVPAVLALRESFALDGIRSQWRELQSYALPRVPGGLGFSALMAIGPYVAVSTGALKEAGFLVIGQALVTISEAGTESFGLVALPKVANLVAVENSQFLRARIADILALVAHVGIFITVQLLLWSDQIVNVWLGRGYGPAVPIVRISVLAVVPYLAYAMLRSVIDAIEVKAVNTRNVFAAAATTAILSAIAVVTHAGSVGLAIANVAGMTMLGVLSVRFLWKSYRPTDYAARIAASLGGALVLGAACWVVKVVLQRHVSGMLLLGAGGACACCAAVMYLLFLRRVGASWVREAEVRILKRV